MSDTAHGQKNGHRGALACLAFLLVFLTLALVSAPAKAAYLIDTESVVGFDGAAVPAKADVIVTRYERIGFYRYDPAAETEFQVFSGDFADQSSLIADQSGQSSDTPQTTDPLPQPVDSSGTPIPLDQSLPLTPTDTIVENQPLFVVLEQPELANEAFGTRADGRRFVAVTIETRDAGETSEHTITLVETAANSGVFTGYLQPDAEREPPIRFPPNGTVAIRYDDYGDVADSQTTQPPSLVAGSVLSGILARRSSQVRAAPEQSPLFLTKQAGRSTVKIGDFAEYRLTLENTDGITATGLELQDDLPHGFHYESGSLRLNGSPVEPENSGSRLALNLPDLEPGESHEIRYVVEVAAGTEPGEAVNQARVQGDNGSSNEAQALVEVERPFFDDSVFLMGRVIVGECGDREAPGMENARLYLEDGTNVRTDERGRWHLEGVDPGTHVLQLDTDSVPERYRLRQCGDNARQAGNKRSRFVDVQGGSLWRENFYLEERETIDGRLNQRLRTEKDENGDLKSDLLLQTGAQALTDVNIELYFPDDVRPEPKSLAIAGEKVAIEEQNNHYRIQVPALPAFTRTQLELPLEPVGLPLAAEKTIQVITTASDEKGEPLRALSQNSFTVYVEHEVSDDMVVHPRFASMAAELDDQGRAKLDEVIAQLKTMPQLNLQVTGYTDDRKISSADAPYPNNEVLSRARAQHVADYLARHLDLADDVVEVIGKGAANPIASNATAEGRARNRRVTIKASAYVDAGERTVEVTEGDSGGSAETTPEPEQAKAAPEPGFVNIHDGMTLGQPVMSVTALLDPELEPRLILNGERVSSERLGMKVVDEELGLTRYTWVGLEFTEPGEHKLQLRGIGPFGNARVNKIVKVSRLAPIKSIKLADQQPENRADGTTPVRVKLEMHDELDRRVRSGVKLDLLSGSLTPLDENERENPLNRTARKVQVDRNGIVEFEPVSTAGTFRLRLGARETESRELEVEVKPELRDWIMVGFAEGQIGYNELEGNMEGLDEDEQHLYTDGETSFFARGRVKGEWLITAAYDSREEGEDEPLEESIDPDEWYTLYGDNAERNHDAPSRDKLFLRIERDNFYALYGDYRTGLTVTELARFNRRFTGFKSEYRGDHVTVNAFATETDQGFVREDLRGDGTSGLYRLERNRIVPGSEQVRIQTRDRFTNEVIEEEERTRFVDYDIDYQSGEIWFKEPVPQQDDSFNPVFIVVEYETENGEENVIGGGRVSVHDKDKNVELGLTGVDDNTQGLEGTLTGSDLTWKPDDNQTLYLERARTRQEQQARTSVDDAWLAEHEFQGEKLNTRVKVEEQQGSFGLGQQAQSEEETRTTTASGRYNWTERLETSAEVSRQQLLDANNQRDQAETRMEYKRDDWSAYTGLRQSEDQIDDKTFRSNQFLAGTRRQFLDNQLEFSLAGETELGGQGENIDFPNRVTAGTDYQLNNAVTLTGRQELSWGPERRTQQTRAGLRATPWNGGTVSTELGREQNESGGRLFAQSGLFQTLELSNRWSLDFGLDRVQTLRDDTVEREAFDRDRPVASGTRNNDYTAFSTGLGYRTAEWQWTTRSEIRRSDQEDKWNVLSGFHHRVNEADTIAGQVQHFQRDLTSGEESRETSVDFSLSRRPDGADWFVLNRTSLVFDAVEDGFGEREGRRWTNNTTANFMPMHKHQLALQYGARYVLETIDRERFQGYTDLMGAEYRYDLTRRWEVGVRGSMLHSWNADQYDVSYGLLTGYSPVQDVWLGLGYNFEGFNDRDFDRADSRRKGVVFTFRIKFDQNSLKRWRNSSAQTAAEQ